MSDIISKVDTIINKNNIKTNSNIEFLPCGSTILSLIGSGGFPVGKMINIVGDKSTGKTLLTLEALFAMKQKYEDKLKIYYDDCESGYSFDTEKIYGKKLFDENIEPSKTIEEMEFNLNLQLNSINNDEYLVYVVDSFDALSSDAEIKRAEKRRKGIEDGKTVDSGTYGMEKQKFCSELFRVLISKIKNKNCLLIIISQVRQNIGIMFGERYTRSGGKALDFYASQIYWLAECEKYKKKDIPTGVCIKVKNKKNKVGLPYRQGFIDILFDYGIDNITSNINFLYDLKTPTGKSQKAKTVKWNDLEPMRPIKLITYIEENNLEDELEQKVKSKWYQIEQDIKTKRKQKY